jgi:hypothetical protein
MPPSILHYLITSIRVRFAAVRSGELDRGALSLEWVVIAIGLVAAAVVVGAFVMNYVTAQDKNIQTPPTNP